MSKRGKTILAYSFLALIVISAIVFLIHLVIAYTAGDSDLSVDYDLVAEDIAGRHYTPQCLVTCDLVFSLSYSGAVTPDSVEIDTKKLTTQFEWIKGQDRLQDIKIYYLYEYQGEVPDYSSSCMPYNTTEGFEGNWSYPSIPNCMRVISGTHFETMQEWRELNSLAMKKGKAYYIDIRGNFNPSIKGFNVDVIPSLNIAGKDFAMNEMAVWDSSWEKKKAVYANTSYNTTEKNFQLKLNVTYDSDMNVDFSDLRFTNSSENQELDYFIESEINSSYAIVWVNITVNITPTQSVVAYMYYKNPGVNTTSNGANTFLEFQDFEGQTLGNLPSGWTQVNGTTITTGWVAKNSSISMRSKGINTTYPPYDYRLFTESGKNPASFPYAVEFNSWYDDSNTSANFAITDDGGSFLNSVWMKWDYDAVVGYGSGKVSVYDGSDYQELGSFTDEGWDKWVIVINDMGNTDFYLNGVNVKSGVETRGNPSHLNTWEPVAQEGENRFDEAYFDVMFVRKWHNFPISYTFGTEQATRASETAGDTAISQGINESVIGAVKGYPSQQVYIINSSNDPELGRFDYVAMKDNQTWAFNYISLNEATSNATHMANITPAFYVWEATDLNSEEIRQRVATFINSTNSTFY